MEFCGVALFCDNVHSDRQDITFFKILVILPVQEKLLSPGFIINISINIFYGMFVLDELIFCGIART